MGHDTSFSEFPEQPRCLQALHDQAIQGTEYGEQAKVAPLTTKTSTYVLILKQQVMNAKFQRYQNISVDADSDMFSFKRNQISSVYADKIHLWRKISWQIGILIKQNIVVKYNFPSQKTHMTVL